jgi:hypothetical protein
MPASSTFRPPTIYALFFLTIEPLLALLGAFFAACRPQQYLELLDPASAPPASAPVPMASAIVLAQLANMYVLFTLNEALVLRATADLRVWRAMLLVMLIADAGHLASVAPLGWDVYWSVARWNRMDWGGIGFVYLMAAMRIAFLAGVGLSSEVQPVAAEVERSSHAKKP